MSQNVINLWTKTVLHNFFFGVLHGFGTAWEWVNEERFTHKYVRWRKQMACERHFTMTCSGPRALCTRSRTRTSAVYLKMWRVSKHLRKSTYEWAGGMCVSCLRALQSWLMCIESSCVMHTHTRLHTNTHIALMPSPAMRQIFFLLPTVAVAMATSSRFLDLKSWIWQEVWASPGGRWG